MGAEQTPKTLSGRRGLLKALCAHMGVKGTGAPKMTGVIANPLLLQVRSLLLLTLLLLICLTMMQPPSASAESLKPWWHITSGSRPTYIDPGTAQSEVQDLSWTVPSGLIELEGPDGKGIFFSAGATREAVQEAFENEYGTGTVEVTGGPGGGGGPPFEIKFIGALRDQAISLAKLLNHHGEVSLTQKVAGHPDGDIVVKVENLGDAPAGGSAGAVAVADALPPGFEAVGISGEVGFSGNTFPVMSCELLTLTCEYAGEVPPYSVLEVRVAVVASTSHPPSSGEPNRVLVMGGGAAEASLSQPLTVSSKPVPFGAEDYELRNEEEGGGVVQQAGAHPFQQTNVVDLNEQADTHPLSEPPAVYAAGAAKNLSFKWPAGLIGNPSSIEKCTGSQFVNNPTGEANECPASSAVGIASVDIYEPHALGFIAFSVPLFNLEPRRGEPARFGFFIPISSTAVYIDAAVRNGQDYGVTVSTSNVTQTVSFLSATVTVWGTPGDARHDLSRGWACVNKEAGCGAGAGEGKPQAFLQLPTSCAKNPTTGEPEPLQTTMQGDSWEQAGRLEAEGRSSELGQLAETKLAEYTMPPLSGCNRLPFEPSIKVTPDDQEASTPTGLDVDVHVPQQETLNEEGLAEGAPRNITVALPPGVQINPSSGDGLLACSEGLVGFTGFSEAFFPGAKQTTFSATPLEQLTPGSSFCPSAAKVGTATIKTPILPDPIEGAVYVATQNANPFGSLIAMYIVAEDPTAGVLVKLAGNVSLCKAAGEAIDGMTCEAPGQIITTFENSPQAPFEDAELHFFGGERAPLATPPHCGIVHDARGVHLVGSEHRGTPAHRGELVPDHERSERRARARARACRSARR